LATPVAGCLCWLERCSLQYDDFPHPSSGAEVLCTHA
jgi:hypothetical protein